MSRFKCNIQTTYSQPIESEYQEKAARFGQISIYGQRSTLFHSSLRFRATLTNETALAASYF